MVERRLRRQPALDPRSTADDAHASDTGATIYLELVEDPAHRTRRSVDDRRGELRRAVVERESEEREPRCGVRRGSGPPAGIRDRNDVPGPATDSVECGMKRRVPAGLVSSRPRSVRDVGAIVRRGQEPVDEPLDESARGLHAGEHIAEAVDRVPPYREARSPEPVVRRGCARRDQACLRAADRVESHPGANDARADRADDVIVTGDGNRQSGREAES